MLHLYFLKLLIALKPMEVVFHIKILINYGTLKHAIKAKVELDWENSYLDLRKVLLSLQLKYKILAIE